jgi:uncharacterized membrane protein
MRLLIALVASIGLAGPANAALSVCNNSVHTVRVALGLFNGTHWASEGWRFIDPKKCSEMVAGPLVARYYYLYATNELFGMWDGNKNFCVTVFEKFSIDGRGRCESRGFYSLGFLEIDTGNHLDWIQTLSDPR